MCCAMRSFGPICRVWRRQMNPDRLCNLRLRTLLKIYRQQVKGNERRTRDMEWKATKDAIIATLVLMLLAGCGGAPAKKQSNEFFTSGSRDADQRASQRMAKDEQLTGSGEGAGEKGTKKAK